MRMSRRDGPLKNRRRFQRLASARRASRRPRPRPANDLIGAWARARGPSNPHGTAPISALSSRPSARIVSQALIRRAAYERAGERPRLCRRRRPQRRPHPLSPRPYGEGDRDVQVRRGREGLRCPRRQDRRPGNVRRRRRRGDRLRTAPA